MPAGVFPSRWPRRGRAPAGHPAVSLRPAHSSHSEHRPCPGFTSQLPGVIALEMPPFFCLTLFCHDYEGQDILINGKAASGFQRWHHSSAEGGGRRAEGGERRASPCPCPVPAPSPPGPRTPFAFLGLFPHTFRASGSCWHPREPRSPGERAPTIDHRRPTPEARGAGPGLARGGRPLWGQLRGSPAPPCLPHGRWKRN